MFVKFLHFLINTLQSNKDLKQVGTMFCITFTYFSATPVVQHHSSTFICFLYIYRSTSSDLLHQHSSHRHCICRAPSFNSPFPYLHGIAHELHPSVVLFCNNMLNHSSSILSLYKIVLNIHPSSSAYLGQGRRGSSLRTSMLSFSSWLPSLPPY